MEIMLRKYKVEGNVIGHSVNKLGPFSALAVPDPRFSNAHDYIHVPTCLPLGAKVSVTVEVTENNEGDTTNV